MLLVACGSDSKGNNQDQMKTNNPANNSDADVNSDNADPKPEVRQDEVVYNI